MPSEPGLRCHQPDHRAAQGPLRRRHLHRPARWVAEQRPRDQRGDPGAGPRRRQRDGFVEALPDSFFTNTRNAQPSGMKGTIINVPVGEATAGTTRIARFGWKNQHASLLSFAADAYLNEMGITSPLQPTENTSNGTSVAAYDTVPDPEDAGTVANPRGTDVEAFTRFMRSAKVPPRDTV